MNNSYWLEKELWKIQQNKLNQLHKLEVVEKPKPQFIARSIIWVGKMMVTIGQYLQTVEQPSYRQAVKNSNI